MAQRQTYTVSGMTCGHCVASVTEEVQEIPDVQDVSVTLDTGELAVISEQGVDVAVVRAAVEEAGYQLA